MFSTTLVLLILTPNQEHFKRRVAEAKKFVPNPIQVDGHPEIETPRIKLKIGAKNPEPAPSKLTLKMRGQTSETPSKDEGSQSGVTVDNESLKRQQDLVRAGSASQDVDAPQMSPRTRSLRRHLESPKSSAATTPSASEQLHNVPVHARDATGPIKDENSLAHSQHAETHSSRGLHESLLDSTSGNPSYDGKTDFLITSCLPCAHTDYCPFSSTFPAITRAITLGFSLEATRSRLVNLNPELFFFSKKQKN
jgi:chromatin structure-remodeling complex subunit RSC4